VSRGIPGIRADVATLLVDAGTAAGARVYDTRVLSWPEDQQFPVLDVWIERSVEEPEGTSGLSYQRTDDLIVEGIVRGSDDADARDRLDTLETQVRRALRRHATWGRQWRRPPTLETGRSYRATDSALLEGSIRMQWSLTQSGIRHDADLDDLEAFEVVNIKTHPVTAAGEPTEDPRAEITITLEGAEMPVVPEDA
jgi:hypothetical protein